VEIAFAEKMLRELCESETKAARELGHRKAKKLMHRLGDLRAATSVAELVAGDPRELDGPCPRPFVVDLCDGACIVFCANHNANPVLESGCINWSKVSRIKILRIENNHG
jgi:toxin HigB-1